VTSGRVSDVLVIQKQTQNPSSLGGFNKADIAKDGDDGHDQTRFRCGVVTVSLASSTVYRVLEYGSVETLSG
jgi:hypothetical protein